MKTISEKCPKCSSELMLTPAGNVVCSTCSYRKTPSSQKAETAKQKEDVKEQKLSQPDNKPAEEKQSPPQVPKGYLRPDNKPAEEKQSPPQVPKRYLSSFNTFINPTNSYTVKVSDYAGVWCFFFGSFYLAYKGCVIEALLVVIMHLIMFVLGKANGGVIYLSLFYFYVHGLLLPYFRGAT